MEVPDRLVGVRREALYRPAARPFVLGVVDGAPLGRQRGADVLVHQAPVRNLGVEQPAHVNEWPLQG